jgi:hypothetical protein
MNAEQARARAETLFKRKEEQRSEARSRLAKNIRLVNGRSVKTLQDCGHCGWRASNGRNPSHRNDQTLSKR